MRRSAMALALLAGCATASGEPRPIAYGRVGCDYCHMTVENPRRSAQLVPERGAVRVFDEPGCLVRYVLRGGLQPGDRLWVQEAAGG